MKKMIKATLLNETLISLKNKIKEVNPYLEKEDLLIGIYLFCSENYSGQGCPLYAILCEINFNYKGNDLASDFPSAIEAKMILESIFTKVS